MIIVTTAYLEPVQKDLSSEFDKTEGKKNIS